MTKEKQERKNRSEATKRSWENMRKTGKDLIRNKKVSESKKGKKKSPEAIESCRQGRLKNGGWNVTKETIKKVTQAKLDKLLSGDFSGLYRKKSYKTIKGIQCKTNCEIKYITRVIQNKQQLPLNAKGIITPFGTFIPSFQTKDYYIVNWTLNTGLIFCQSDQVSKQIKWVTENQKPVMILITRFWGEVIYEQLIDKVNIKDIKTLKDQCKTAIEKDELTEEEKELRNLRKSESLKKMWKENRDTATFREGIEKIRAKAIGRTRSQESKDKQALTNTGKIQSFETLQKRANTRLEKMLRGETVGVRCKIFIVGGLPCQGTFEKGYIEELIANNKELPISGKGVNTPFGLYSPDFDFPDYYIEIKSQFTYKIFTGQIENINGHFCNGQRQKATWTAQNIKPVIVLIYNKPGKLAFTEDLSFI